MVRKVALTFQPDACLGVDFRQVDRNGYAGRTGVPLARREKAPHGQMVCIDTGWKRIGSYRLWRLL
jgi:hypothetical protein